MTKPKRKPRIVPLIKPRRVLPEGWTVGTLAQWLPVMSVAAATIYGYATLQNRVDTLEKSATAATDITSLKDQINEVAKDESKLEVKEGNDFAEAKSNDVAIWAYVGRGKEGASKP